MSEPQTGARVKPAEVIAPRGKTQQEMIAKMIERCDDPECPGYGQKYADRGYGYPVCSSQKWYSERFPGSENKPLKAEYRQAVGA